MNRKEFFKKSFLGIVGLALFPNELLSNSAKEINNSLEVKNNDIEIPKDLIYFAKHFSSNYKKIKCGMYISDCGKYRIEYLHRIRDINGKRENTYGKISHTTSIMYFNKSKMVNMPKSFIFNTIIWCYVAKQEGLPTNHIYADLKALKCSLENGYSKKELFVSQCKFLNPEIRINKKRIDDMYDFLKDEHKI